MKTGIMLNLYSWPRQDGFKRFALGVEELGYNSLWFGDHVVIPENFESDYPYLWRFPGKRSSQVFDSSSEFIGLLAMTGYVCGITSRLRVGLGVLLPSMRNAVECAKELGSLHAISGERLICGVGAGWLKEEFDVLGAPFDRRGPRLDESIDVMRVLWSQEQPVSFDGVFYRFDRVFCNPAPATPPPVWIGGQTAAALTRCARRGDGWYALDLNPEDFADVSRRLTDRCHQLGRDPGTIERGVSARLLELPDHELLAAIEAYAEAGCDHLMIFGIHALSSDENLAQFVRLRGLLDSSGLSTLLDVA